MFNEIFKGEALVDAKSSLSHTITRGSSGCMIKFDNQSPYALDVFNQSQLVERVLPYSYSVIPQNANFEVKVNKDIKSNNVQPYNYVGYKTASEFQEGSLHFGGDMTVSGDVNVKGDVNISNVPKMELVGEQTVNIANVPKMELVGDNTVNIGNIPKVEIASGTVNASIQDATINTELVNARLSTNSMVLMEEKVVSLADTSRPFEVDFRNQEGFGIYDGVVVYYTSEKGQFYRMEPWNASVYLDSEMTGEVFFTVDGATNNLAYGNFSEAAICNRIKLICNLNPEFGKQKTDKLTMRLYFFRSSVGSTAQPVRVEIANEFFKQKMRGVDYANQDLNKITRNGMYSGYTLTNAPSWSQAGYCYHFNYRDNYGDQYAFQVFSNVSSEGKMAYRKKIAGYWSEWVDLVGRSEFHKEVQQSGRITITPSAANTVKQQNVRFSRAFQTAPIVVASAISTVPHYITCAVGNVTTTGFDIFMTRTTTTATSIGWIAIPQSQ